MKKQSCVVALLVAFLSIGSASATETSDFEDRFLDEMISMFDLTSASSCRQPSNTLTKCFAHKEWCLCKNGDSIVARELALNPETRKIECLCEGNEVQVPTTQQNICIYFKDTSVDDAESWSLDECTSDCVEDDPAFGGSYEGTEPENCCKITVTRLCVPKPDEKGEKNVDDK